MQSDTALLCSLHAVSLYEVNDENSLHTCAFCKKIFGKANFPTV